MNWKRRLLRNKKNNSRRIRTIDDLRSEIAKVSVSHGDIAKQSRLVYEQYVEEQRREAEKLPPAEIAERARLVHATMEEEEIIAEVDRRLYTLGVEEPTEEESSKQMILLMLEVAELVRSAAAERGKATE